MSSSTLLRIEVLRVEEGYVSGWLRVFHQRKLARLRLHYEFVAENLKNVGLPFVAGNGGLFLLVSIAKVWFLALLI